MTDLDALLRGITEEERVDLMEAVDAHVGDMEWFPNPGPQSDAFFSEADELFYGGAAGGGKTDLILGIANTEHQRSLILRRQGTDLGAIEDRLVSMVGSKGFNKTTKILRRPGRFVELSSCPHEKDKEGFQGQNHDLKAFDEICQFSYAIYSYVIGWNRPGAGSKPGQRCRVVCAGNPPSTPEGEWVKRYWGAWLDPQHPNPAKPGELRWYTMIGDESVEVDKDWRGVDATGEEIGPRSRTFIPALLRDNPYLGAEYRATLANMPEPYRTQLLTGSFTAGVEDHKWQLIPTKWVRAAVERGRQRKALRDANAEGVRRRVMTSLGNDVAMGGKDNFVLAPVYDNTECGDLIVVPGKDVTDGVIGGALVLQHYRDNARVVVDMGGGYGDGIFTHIANVLKVRPHKYKGGEGSSRQSRSGFLFANRRTEVLWLFREMLDPDNPDNFDAQICLPDDDRLVADLVACRFEIRGNTIHAEPKEALIVRIGRSPDRGDAVVLAFSAPPVHPDEVERVRTKHGDDPQYARMVTVERGYEAAKRR